MDAITADRLEMLAPNLQKFLELDPEDQDWIFPMLGRAERRALKILEEIQNHPLSYEEIAKLTDTHHNTVRGMLNALERGGIAFRSNTSGKWVTSVGGRHRTLKKLQK